VEQHVTQILKVASRAYVMSRGEIVLSGTAREILARRDEIQSAYIG
jgi:branched-chain amino acid transport system ATP-binding protein